MYLQNSFDPHQKIVPQPTKYPEQFNTKCVITKSQRGCLSSQPEAPVEKAG
jgi:hypothetical protein